MKTAVVMIKLSPEQAIENLVKSLKPVTLAAKNTLLREDTNEKDLL